MASFIRRLQRQVVSSAAIHRDQIDPDAPPHANGPRGKFYMKRGLRLGTKNPKDRALLSRLAREKRNAARKAAK